MPKNKYVPPTDEELEEITAKSIPRYEEMDDEHKEYAKQAMATQVELCDSGREFPFGERMDMMNDTAELLLKATGDRGIYLMTLTDGVMQELLHKVESKSDVFIIQGKTNEMVEELLHPTMERMLGKILRR